MLSVQWPPDTNYNEATEKLVDFINEFELKYMYPDAIKLIMGDFECKLDEHIYPILNNM